jgi:DNA repair exonuclease SbcCD nuclease subunit
MKYKGVTFGDVHYGAGEPKMLSNEISTVLFPFIETNKPNFVILSGDYFDRKLMLNSEACRLAIKTMYDLIALCESIDCKLRVLRGTVTHDLNQLDIFKHLESEAECFRLINMAEYEELLPDMHVLYIPEEYPEDQNEYYSQFFSDLDGGRFDFIFGHGTFEFESFKGQKFESERPIKSAPVFSEKEFLNYANYIFFNHIHHRSSYAGRVFYNSSFSRTSFGEEEPKGFHFVEYDSDKCKAQIHFVENNLAPTYNTFHIDDIRSEVGNDPVEVLRAIQVLKNQSYRIRLLTNSGADDGENLVLREHFSETSGVTIKNFKGVAASKITSDEYNYVFEEGDDLVTTVRRFVSRKFGRNYTNDQITDCISPSNNDNDEDE